MESGPTAFAASAALGSMNMNPGGHMHAASSNATASTTPAQFDALALPATPPPPPPPPPMAPAQTATATSTATARATIDNSHDHFRDTKPVNDTSPTAAFGSIAAPATPAVADLGGSSVPFSLDTPAGPAVDHGIESNLRDSLAQDNEAPILMSTDTATGPHAPLPDPFPQSNLEFGFDDSAEFFSTNLGPGDLLLPAEPTTPLNALVQTTSQTQTEPEDQVEEEEQTSHEAYAMLKFRDSYYYVKTPNVVLARDEAFLQALKQAKRLEKKQRKAQAISWKYKQEPSQPSLHGDEDNEDLIGRPAHGLLSTYSEQGGAVSYADPNEYEDPFVDMHSRRYKHNSSSNQSIAPRSLHELEEGFEQHGQRVDSHKQDPDQWAQLAIHPAVAEDIRAISREHLVIRFDSDLGRWVVDVVGNGMILNNEFHPKGTVGLELHSGDEIMVTSVVFHFHLPPAVDDDDDDVLESVEQDDDSSSPAARRNSDAVDDIDSEDDGSDGDDKPLAQRTQSKKPKIKLKLGKKKDQSGKQPAKTGGRTKGKAPAKAIAKSAAKAPKPAQPATVNDEDPAVPKEHEEGKPSEDVDTRKESQVVSATDIKPQPSTEAPASESAPAVQASPPAPVNLDPNSAFATLDPEQYPQKRKGPGRPPKNGLISKRDDAAVKRKVRELERAGQSVPDLNVVLEIVRAEQRAKDAQAKAQARGEAPPDIPIQSIEAHVQNATLAGPAQTPGLPQPLPQGSGSPSEVPAVRPMSPKPRRIAKSPSPVPPESSFTEEELKKPNMTYIYIIDEILQSIEGGQADLQTIYDKIIKKWPYFKYRCPTNGWQSSVRHNLLQCGRFAESGKSGKGKYWKINWAHELDNKKRKPTPPPRPVPPPMQNGQQYGYNGTYQGPYNANGQQGSGPYNSPYTGGYAANGQRAGSNGSPAQQSRPSAQPPQPQAPQTPFQRLVAEIIAFQTAWLQQYVGQSAHTQAQADCSRALTYYSDVLHTGGAPDPSINEELQPFKTMKELFMKYPELIKNKGEQKEESKVDGGATSSTGASAGQPATTQTVQSVPPNGLPNAASQQVQPPATVPNAPSTATTTANAPPANAPPANAPPANAPPANAPPANAPPANAPNTTALPASGPPARPSNVATSNAPPPSQAPPRPPIPIPSSAHVSGPAPPPLMPYGSPAPIANMRPAPSQQTTAASRPQGATFAPQAPSLNGPQAAPSPIAPKAMPLNAPSPTPTPATTPRPSVATINAAAPNGQQPAAPAKLPLSAATSTAQLGPAPSVQATASATTSRPVAPPLPIINVTTALASTAQAPQASSPKPALMPSPRPLAPAPAAAPAVGPVEPKIAATRPSAASQAPAKTILVGQTAPVEPPDATAGSKRSADDAEGPDAKRTKLSEAATTVGA